MNFSLFHLFVVYQPENPQQAITHCCVQLRAKLVRAALHRERADRKKSITKYVPDVCRAVFGVLQSISPALAAAGGGHASGHDGRDDDEDDVDDDEAKKKEASMAFGPRAAIPAPYELSSCFFFSISPQGSLVLGTHNTLFICVFAGRIQRYLFVSCVNVHPSITAHRSKLALARCCSVCWRAS